MNISSPWLIVAAFMGLVAGWLASLVLDRFPRAFVRSWLRDAARALTDAQLLHDASSLPMTEANSLVAGAATLTAHLAAVPAPDDAAPRAPWHRYVLPVACAAIFPALVGQLGSTPVSGLWCVFALVLLALAAIDLEMLLLPDVLTLPLLWAGLAASAFGLTIPLHDAVLGAVAGYVPLWLLCCAFKLTTGQEGMGMGDLKLLAAMGAWLGWAAVTPIAAGAAVIGSVVNLVLRAKGRATNAVPFGPSLASAGLVVAIVGSNTITGQLLALLRSSLS